jgi:hypothetical protein
MERTGNASQQSYRHPDCCLPRFYTAQRTGPSDLPAAHPPLQTTTADCTVPPSARGPTSRRRTTHSRSSRHSEHGETRQAHGILTINNLYYAILYDFEMLINIIYVLYCDCHYKLSHCKFNTVQDLPRSHNRRPLTFRLHKKVCEQIKRWIADGILRGSFPTHKL